MLNTQPRLELFVGFDYREAANYAVCCSSAREQASSDVFIHGLVLDELKAAGLYTRAVEVIPETGQLWDPISDAAMSTQFAISRFLTPLLAQQGVDWALFCDCDVLFRADPFSILDYADPSKAVMCVKHDHVPDSTVKKLGAVQASYSRKNWSSVMLFNCSHPSNRKLTPELVNTVPGRDLHRFCWLEDDEIGALPVEWNFLVNVTQPLIESEPKLVHWTLGGPALPGYQNVPYADEYFEVLNLWAAGGGRS